MSAKTFLFVYGTLMQTCKSEMGRPQRARLATEGVFIGPARVTGNLYDMGAYPALKINDNNRAATPNEPRRLRAGGRVGRGRVSGHVMQLANGQKSFPWLDAYEGVQPAVTPTTRGYQRTTAQINLDLGQLLTAYLYVICGPIERGRRIPDGIWRERKPMAQPGRQ